MKTVASDQLYLEISREFLVESFALDWMCDNDNIDELKAERRTEKISKKRTDTVLFNLDYDFFSN